MLTRLFVAAALLTCASPLLAQEYKDAHRLGGATAFYKPQLTNAASLKRMAERQGMADDIRTVLRDAGIPDVSSAFLAAMSRGTSSGSVGSCSNAAPADGEVVECDAAVGTTFDWMAYRERVKGKRVPGRLPRVRWAGKKAFAAFLFRVSVGDKRYTFIVPKPCGNLSLVSVGESQAAVAAREQAARDQAAREQAARDQAARDQAARDQAARDQAARDQAARDQAARDQAARDQAAREQAARDQAARDQVARNEAAPAPVNPGAPAPSANAADSTPASTEKPSPFFVDVLAGGERRNRPADLAEGKPTDFTQGSGFIGLKIGAAKKFESNWEVAGAFGVGGMFLFKHDTINEWPWFADVEVNRYFGKAFVGTGLSIWDFTRSDLWVPAGALRFGIPLGHHPKHPIYFLGEGRWYLDHRTHLETHRQMWGGLRIHL